MVSALQKLNNKIDDFLYYNLIIDSQSWRTILMVAFYLVVLTVLFWLIPVLLGIYLILLAKEKIPNKKYKFAVFLLASLVISFVGIPWVAAVYHSIDKPAVVKTQSVEKKQLEQILPVTIAEKIPFQVKEIKDPSIYKGQTKLKQAGTPGSKSIRYMITYTSDGHEAQRVKISEIIVAKPADKLILVGTREKTAAKPTPTNTRNSVDDPDYSQDCFYYIEHGSSSKNGSSHSWSRAYLNGREVKELDPDHDGIICE